MVNIKLTLSERMEITLFFPERTNRIKMKMLNDVEKKIEISDKEREILGPMDPRMTYGAIQKLADEKGIKEKIISFTDAEYDLLYSLIDAKDKKDEIPRFTLSLVDKIMDKNNHEKVEEKK